MLGFYRRIMISFKHLGESVRSNYGSGPFRYFKFIYYSLLRLNTFNVYEKDLEETAPNIARRDDLEFMEIGPEKLDEYRGEGFSQEFFIDEVGDISTCHLVLCNGKAAYIHWIYPPGARSRFLNLKDRSAEINYIHTRPEFRRKGICLWALEMGVSLLSSQGMKKAITVVHADNVASCGAMESAGFIQVAKVRSIGPFNRRMNI